MPTVTAIPTPAGDLGTYVTLALMRARARADAISPVVRRLATGIAASVGSYDGTAQALAIRDYLADYTQFLRDPQGAELLHSPAYLAGLLLRGGTVYVDCDDVAALAASLGLAVGLRARFIAVAFGSPRSPYRHVWTELRSPVGGPWVSCDVTLAQQGLADVPITRRLVWEV
jgi:hypothetical protein